jgi:hypothetical protein
MLEETLLGYALESLHTKNDSAGRRKPKRPAGVIQFSSAQFARQKHKRFTV